MNSGSNCTKQTFSIKNVEYCDENEAAVSDAPSTCNHDQDSHDSDNDACSSNSEEVCILCFTCKQLHSINKGGTVGNSWRLKVFSHYTGAL